MIPENTEETCYRGVVIYYTGNRETTTDVWSKSLITQGSTQVYSSFHHAVETVDHILDRRGKAKLGQCDESRDKIIIVAAALIGAYIYLTR